MDVRDINIKDVKVIENTRTSMKEIENLMEDIRQHGLKQPIGVSKTKTNDLILVWGHRRLVACEKLGWKKIPANVGNDMEMKNLLIANLGENIQRVNTTPAEDGRIFERLRKMELNNSEIAALLSIPQSRVARCLDIYMGLPEKTRRRVSYHGMGGGSRKGRIPASVAIKMISIKKSHGLSEKASDLLENTVHMEELKIPELGLIATFLDQGMSVKDAIERRKEYTSVRVDITIKVEELEAIMAKHKIDSNVSALQSIIYGLIPPIKKPDFIKIKQTAVNVKE